MFAEAQKQVERAIELRRHTLGSEHPDTLNSRNELAVLERRQGNNHEAEVLLSSVVESRRRVLGKEHRDTLISINDLALIYDDLGKYTQAESLLRSAVDAWRRRGDSEIETLTSTINLARIYRDARANTGRQSPFSYGRSLRSVECRAMSIPTR